MANLRKKAETLPVAYFRERGQYLHMAVKYSGVVSNYRSTGIKIANGEQWNAKARSIAHNDQSTAKVRKYETDLTHIYYTLSGKGQNTNAHLLLDYIMGHAEFTKQVPTLLGCFDAFIDDQREAKDNGQLKAVTFGRHMVRRANVAEFLSFRYKTEHLPLDQLQPIIQHQYRTFLKIQKGYGIETINKDMSQFKRVLCFAVMHGWTNKNVFDSYHAEPVERNVKALTIDEVRKIADLQNLDPTTDKVRWLFLFLCYTGLNHSDLNGLQPKHLYKDTNGDTVLNKERTKNSMKRDVFLPVEALYILQKYEAHKEKTGFLLPFIIEKEANKYLKVIQALIQFERFPLVTSTGRKSYSSIMANAGAPLDILRHATGHTNTQTLNKHYVRINPATTNAAIKKAWGNIEKPQKKE